MRYLSKKLVREQISLSFATIDRLENAGKFPKRVPLTEPVTYRCKRTKRIIRKSVPRVGWVEAEVHEWMNARLAERDAPAPQRDGRHVPD
jgi:predicted DNA-binding transcriptional regulator AlpA